MLAQLDKLGVQASDIAELGGAELGEVRVDIKSQYRVLLAIPLESRDLGLELVVLLLPLRPVAMVSLRLLLALLRIGRPRRILARHLWLLQMVAVLWRRAGPALRILVAHVAVLLTTFVVRGSLRRQRG